MRLVDLEKGNKAMKNIDYNKQNKSIAFNIKFIIFDNQDQGNVHGNANVSRNIDVDFIGRINR